MKEFGIPKELQDRPQWICWKAEKRGGKLTKIPKDPKNKRNAKVNDPETWSDFNTAWMRYNSDDYDGVGFVFTANDPYCGIDLDSCRDLGTGEVDGR